MLGTESCLEINIWNEIIKIGMEEKGPILEPNLGPYNLFRLFRKFVSSFERVVSRPSLSIPIQFSFKRFSLHKIMFRLKFSFRTSVRYYKNF